MWCYIKIAKNEAKKVNKNNALVAQLDRALDYESRGQGFESSRAHHFLNKHKSFKHLHFLALVENLDYSNNLFKQSKLK